MDRVNMPQGNRALHGDRLLLSAKSSGILHTHLIDSKVRKTERSHSDFKPKTLHW